MIPSLSFRGPVLLGLVALVVLVIGFGAWAFLARLQGAVILQGQIVVEDSRQVIQHPEGGVVAHVFVREGDKVAAGATLVQLEAPELLSQHRIVADRLAELAARSARLVAERDGDKAVAFPDGILTHAMREPGVRKDMAGQTRLFDLRLALFRDANALLSQRVEQLQAQAQGITAEEEALNAELRLVQEELADQNALYAKGLSPQAPVMALRRAAAQLRGKIAELAVAKAQTQGQITETTLRIGSLRTERIEAAVAELREIEPQMVELAETQRALAARIDRLTIRAPVSGTVLGLQGLKSGVVVQPAQPILSLVPTDRPLVISARLGPEDVDAVFLGQKAEFAVSALTDRSVPRLHGKVSMIAADTLVAPDTGAAFYPMELVLDEKERDRLGNHPLLPGMRIQVFLATKSRSPMAYLLEPFTVFFTHALREG